MDLFRTELVISEYLFLLFILFSSSILSHESISKCSCKNVPCSSLTACKGTRLETSENRCGCCFVCKELSGKRCVEDGNKDPGKCERTLTCENKNGLKNTGSCESVDLVSRKVSCYDGKTGYLDRHWNESCSRTKMESDSEILQKRLFRLSNSRGSKKKPSCLSIGCGVSKSMSSPFCRSCEPGNPRVVCSRNGMLMTVPKSIMTRRTFEKSSLINERCVGYENQTHFYYVTSWKGCGTKMRRDGSISNYTNKVIMGKSSHQEVRRTIFEFFCVRKYTSKTLTIFRIRQQVIETGVGMQLTSEGGRIFPNKRNVTLTHKEEKMYVSISAPLIKRFRIRMVINWCALMSTKKMLREKDTRSYLLIDRGCIVEDRAKIKYKRKDVIWFSIKKPDIPLTKLYLHCDMMICPEKAAEGRCSTDCVGLPNKARPPRGQQ